MQMILVCTSCIGQIDYIPLRHYQYVTNVSDTYYPSKYIQRFRSPFLVLVFTLFRDRTMYLLYSDLEVHIVLRCILPSARFRLFIRVVKLLVYFLVIQHNSLEL